MDFRAFLFVQENKLTSRLYFEYIYVYIYIKTTYRPTAKKNK